MSKIIHLSSLVFIVLLISCSSRPKKVSLEDTQVNTGYETLNKDEFIGSADDVKNPAPEIDLSSHLRRLAGVNIRGKGADAIIVIRGGAVSTSYQEPLFLVNGNIISGGYSSVYQLVNTNDIKKITVLRDGSSTAMYGIRGAAGVILIDLK